MYVCNVMNSQSWAVLTNRHICTFNISVSIPICIHIYAHSSSVACLRLWRPLGSPTEEHDREDAIMLFAFQVRYERLFDRVSRRSSSERVLDAGAVWVLACCIAGHHYSVMVTRWSTVASYVYFFWLPKAGCYISVVWSPRRYSILVGSCRRSLLSCVRVAIHQLLWRHLRSTCPREALSVQFPPTTSMRFFAGNPIIMFFGSLTRDSILYTRESWIIKPHRLSLDHAASLRLACLHARTKRFSGWTTPPNLQSMFVCMYVRMYVCMYVSMHLCMHI